MSILYGLDPSGKTKKKSLPINVRITALGVAARNITETTVSLLKFLELERGGIHARTEDSISVLFCISWQW